jgi:hypothetical protein
LERARRLDKKLYKPIQFHDWQGNRHFLASCLMVPALHSPNDGIERHNIQLYAVSSWQFSIVRSLAALHSRGCQAGSRQQFDALSEQANSIAAHTKKAAAEIVEPTQVSVAEAFKLAA